MEWMFDFFIIVTSNFCLLSLKISLLSCLLLVISFLFHPFSLPFKVFLFLTMSSFLFDSAIGMGGNDYGGLIQQPLMDRKVISISSSSSEDTRHGASDSESSSSKRLRVLHHTERGTSSLYWRV